MPKIVNASGVVETIPWRELQVGQILCVRNNEELPADIVLLATSEEEGRCFIETCNLDGETNLKRRVAVKATARLAGWRALNAVSITTASSAYCDTARELLTRSPSALHPIICRSLTSTACAGRTAALCRRIAA